MAATAGHAPGGAYLGATAPLVEATLDRAANFLKENS